MMNTRKIRKSGDGWAVIDSDTGNKLATLNPAHHLPAPGVGDKLAAWLAKPHWWGPFD
jgi:hypothetical protein